VNSVLDAVDFWVQVPVALEDSFDHLYHMQLW
jgi:hypothetical protein